ncbi:MAG: Mut7-C RNAse domain-containing protein [Clostridiales bacterium]|nr:Mut7-C RNAse domain-containing protein [Clostridiales bacterium]
MKFVVDCMLGKLAKWLKILGFDVAYFNRAEDGKLLSLARKEGRVLLTRDHRLRAEAKDVRSLLIGSENWKEQLEQVLDEFQLKREVRPYSRCIQCNSELKSLSKRAAKNLVAPFVYEQATVFAICPACGRVFWQGTHFEDMDGKIGQILGRGRASSPVLRKRRPSLSK